MSVITISRGSYSWGKEVAEKVARKLGYECVARDVLIEASKEFNIPEVKLVRAIQDAPSFFDRFTLDKEKYITYIRTSILRYMCKGNVVYHGVAGHFFVRNISHVLKVRIIADLEDRVKLVMERDESSRKEALSYLKKIDEQRRKWSQQLYGIDPRDPGLYDLVIHIRKITVDDAVDLIAHAVQLPTFQVTPESRRALEDLSLEAEVRSVLIAWNPDIDVSVQNGLVRVKAKVVASHEMAMSKEIEKVISDVPGVRGVRMEVAPSVMYGD